MHSVMSSASKKKTKKNKQLICCNFFKFKVELIKNATDNSL